MMEILFFTSESCAPCKAMKSYTRKYSNITEINVEKDTRKSMEYNIRSLPTLVRISEHGDVEDYHVGMMTESELIKFGAV